MYRPIPRPFPMPVVSMETKNIRVSKTTAAQRTNEFNMYRYKYYVGYPENSSYNVCRPSSSSIYMMPNKFYSYKVAEEGSDLIGGNPGCES